MSDQWKWWEQEKPAEAVLRKLAVKAGKLGRLPTREDIEQDAELPTATEIVMTVSGGSLEAVLKKLAGLLYKRGTCPVDLTEKELALPETERLEVERQYREYYEKRLAQASRPGGIREIEEEQERRWRKSDDVDESKVVKLPILSRRELWERHDPEVLRKQWNNEGLTESAARREQSTTVRGDGGKTWRKWTVVIPSGNVKSADDAKSAEARIASLRPKAPGVSLRPKASGARAAPAEVEARESVLTVGPKETEERTNSDLRKGADSMSKKVTKEQALEALVKVYRHNGGKLSQYAVMLYAREHKGEGIPAAETAKKLLGEPTTWAEQVEEYLREHPELNVCECPESEEVASGVAEAASEVPEVAPVDVEESEPEKVEGSVVLEEPEEEPAAPEELAAESPEVEPEGAATVEEHATAAEKTVIKFNVTHLAFGFNLNGRAYEFQIGFGPEN